MDEDTKQLEESKEPPLRSQAVVREGHDPVPADGGHAAQLLYVRSVVSEKSPWDLGNYQEDGRVFPHHSTFDQFFDDQKFEAYRRLGTCAARNAMEMAGSTGATDDNGAHLVQPRTYSATGKLKLELEPDEV